MSNKMSQFPAIASIKDAAKILNVSTKTLRRWEAKGLLIPMRTIGGHRRYELSKIQELKGNKKKVRLLSALNPISNNDLKAETITPKNLDTAQINKPYIPQVVPEEIKVPLLYKSLHIDQVKILRGIATFTVLMLIIYSGTKLVKAGKLDFLTTRFFNRNTEDIADGVNNQDTEGAVLAATTSNVSPTFSINIKSAFKDSSLFTKDVEIDGDLTLKKRIIGGVDLTGVVIVGGDSITTSQSTFNLINTTATTLNIGGSATTLNLGSTSGGTTVNNSLTVKGTEAVTGAATIGGNLTTAGDLDVSGSTTLGGAETVAGKITGSGDLAISGNGTFGNITSINGVTYSFPGTQGASNTLLTNDGSGTLTWTNPNLSGFSGVLAIANGGTNNSTAYTAGSVIFSDGTKLTEDNTNFFWDDTNNRLGIGNVAPTTALDVTGAGTFSSTLTASNGLNLTTGALNLTSTSGTTNLTSTATSGNSFAFTNSSLDTNNANLALLTFQNANTGAGVLTNGLRIVASGSTPLSGTNTENLISLSGSTLGNNTFNGIYFNTGLSNYVNSTNWTVTAAGAETIASDLGVNGGNITTSQTTANIFTSSTTLGIGNAAGITTINGALAINGNSTFGDAITDSITFSGRVAQDSDLIPIALTGTNDLGSTLLPWDNVYATAFTQNGNLVCDASGANCPGGASSSQWGLASGTLYPLNNSVDLLLGSSATSSAKFAFINVLTGTPTASISGSTANVATYLNGNGNLSTTNFGGLILGGATTGNITLNPSNSIAGGFVAPNTNNVTDLGQSSLVWRNIYGGTIAATAITQSGNAVCDSSGANCPVAGSGGSKWRLLSGAITPFTDTLDVLVGGTSTSSAKFAFKNVLAGTPTASISGSTANVATYLTGNGNLSTTNFADLTIGSTTTGNIIVNPSNSIAGGYIAPATTDVTDLGTSASLEFRNVYAKTFTQNGNSICDTSGNCLGIASYLQLSNKILSPANSTYDLAIGGTATGSAFQVFGIEQAAGKIAKLNSSVITTGNVIEATASAITSGNIVKLGTGGSNGNFTGNGIYMDFDNTGGNSFTGNFVKFDNTAATKFTVDSSGNVNLAAGSAVDTLTAGTLSFGTATANAISIGKTSVTTTNNGSLTSTETLTASNGLTLTTGALNLTSTSGTSSLTSTATSGDSFAFTNNSLNTASANLANYTVKNNNTAGAGLSVTGVNITGTGSTPLSGTNTTNLINLSTTALANNTFNGINFGNGLTNYINGTNFTVTAAGNISALGGTTISGGTINLNYTGTSSTNIGNTTGTTTVAGNILPTTTNSTSLGSSSSLQFATIYANLFSQNGNLVCDAAGNNCPTGTSGGSKWRLLSGAISPFTDSLDVLIGSSATASAKFAFKNVAAGTPTASISGSTANVATFIDGNGNISSTNKNSLILGNSSTYNTTGNILLNPNGTGNVGIGVATTPATALEVNGKTTLAAGSTGGIKFAGLTSVIYSNGNGIGISPQDGTIYYGAGGALDGFSITNNVYSSTTTGIMKVAALGSISTTTGNPGLADFSGTFTPASGTPTNRGIYINPTINWGGTPGAGSYEGLNISAVETSLPTGTNYLIRARAGASGTTDKFSVTNGGDASMAGTLTIANGQAIRPAYGPLTLNYKSAANTWTTGFSLTDTTGNAVVAQDLAVNGGDLTTSQSTATLFDTTATTLSLGGAATTALNIGNGAGAYTAINLGSGAGTHTINIAGTGATAADTINIGTGGTGADTINIGSSASSTALTLTSGTGSQTFASSVATTTGTSGGFVFTGNSLTTGTGMYVNSSSITTGDLVQINSTGTTLTSGYLLNVKNNSSSVFNIGASQITSALPHQFTAAGDTVMAYDLVFSNQTASTIDSYGPLTVRSGESFESNNLTLTSYNSGNILLNTGATAGLVGIGAGITPSGLLTIDSTGTNAIGKATLIVNQDESQDIFTASASGTTRITLSSTGNFGIGTRAPANLLDVSGSSTSTASAMIRNTSTTAATVGLAIKMDATTIDGTTRFINFMDKTGAITGKIQGNTATTVSFTGNGTDMAEYFVKNDPNASFATGTVMCQGQNGLVACSSNDSAKIIGIVSESPSFIGGREGSDKVLVGLTGQVPILVDPTSPSLNPGDLVTISSNGLATKAISAGFIIGRVQTPWNSGSSNSTNVVISNIWADPGIALNSTGYLNIAADQDNPGYSKLTDKNGTTISMLSGLTSLLTNSFTAFQGTVDNLLVKAGLVSPEILTHDIKPLAGDKNINITIGSATESGKLAIKNDAGDVVAGIDSTGNATFSGTLHAGTIYADQIISKEAKFGDTNTNTLGGITRQEIEDLLNSVETDQQMLNSSQNWSVNTATNSASLNELNLKDLYVTGVTALDSLSVAHSITLGGDLAISKITSGNSDLISIDTLVNPLSLQSSASQPLYIMAGKVQIDTNGNMQVLGNLAVGGVLSASAVNIAEDPNAVSDANILTSQASAGVGTIASGSAELTIQNPNIKSGSLIFTTPTSETIQTLFVKSEATGSAVIGFKNPAESNTTFNWWIVNQVNGSN